MLGHSEFPNSIKNVVYTSVYKSWRFSQPIIELKVKSLLVLASEKVVKDVDMVLYAVSYLPSNILTTLMQRALLLNRPLAVNSLVIHWPYKSLSLLELTVTQVCQDRSPSLKKFNDTISNYDVAVDMLLNAYLKLGKQTPSHSTLRLLDFRGPILRDEAIEKIMHQVLSSKYSREITDKFTLIVDVAPQNPTSIMKLFQLSMPSNQHRSIRLLINTIVLSGIPNEEILFFMKSYDNEEKLKGLSFSMSNITEAHLVQLQDSYNSFKEVRALDFSYTQINLTACPLASIFLKNCLASMTDLRSLDLCGCLITGYLRRLLNSIQSGLSVLNISMCRLSTTDLAYLSKSIHMASLKSLDLGYTNLQNCNNLLELLNNLEVIEILCIEKCGLEEEFMLTLFGLLERKTTLRELDIRSNRCSSEWLSVHVPRLSNLKPENCEQLNILC